MPVARDSLMAFRGFRAALRALLVQLTAKLRVNRKTCFLYFRSQQPRLYPGWLPSCQSRSRLWTIPDLIAVS
jgi:hypothetical protein